VKPDAKATVTVPALGRTFDGTLRELGVVANPLTRTYSATFAVPNPNGELRPGMIAEIRLSLDGEPEAIIVPPEVVRVDEAGSPCVYVVGASDVLSRRKVILGENLGEGTVIAKGLADGERVVTSGTSMLADGVSVRVLSRGEH